MRVELVTVLENREIAHRIYKMTLQGEMVQHMTQPGHFVNVRVNQSNEFLLRRPISICDIQPDAQTFTIIYRAEGEGTKRLAQIKAGEFVDVLGPLGKGYDISTLKPNQTALLVGGGIGVPPMYELAKQFRKNGIHTIHVLGFNSQRDVFYEEEFKALGETYIATADGSYGEQGFVTAVIERHHLQFDKYYACGPVVMLEALKRQCVDKEGYLSLEERMACGVGACYACVCKTKKNPTARVCFDGPVFPATEILE